MSRRPTRVLSFGPLPPEWGGRDVGGVAVFHATLIRELTASPLGVEVAGIVAHNFDASSGRTPPVPVLALEGDRPTGDFYRDLLDRVQPDVIVLHHVANRFAAAHARAGSPVPAIGVVHSWHPVTTREGEESERVGRLAQEGLSGVSAAVFPSQHALAEGRRLGFEYPSPARVIPYALDHGYTSPAPRMPQDRPARVAFVGNLIPRKGPAALVAAMSSLPDVELEILGRGEEEDRLRALTTELGVQSRVRIRAPDLKGRSAEPKELLLRSEVLCLPSASESFGIVFIEALACGTPVVGFAPTVREIQERLEIECGEPLEEPAPAAIAHAIGRVREREFDRQALRARTLEHFSPQPVAAAYAELLREVSEAA